MAQLSLYPSTSGNFFIAGLNSQKIVDPLSFLLSYPTTLALQVYLMQPVQFTDPSTFPYSALNTAGLGLLLELTDGQVDTARTVYTQQVSWTPDPTGSFLYANLALNTPAIKALLQASAPNPSTVYLKIAYVQNGLQFDVITKQVQLNIGVGTAALVVPPGLTPLSVEQGNQMYVGRQPIPGDAVYLASAAGKIISLQAVDNPDGSASFVATPFN